MHIPIAMIHTQNMILIIGFFMLKNLFMEKYYNKLSLITIKFMTNLQTSEL